MELINEMPVEVGIAIHQEKLFLPGGQHSTGAGGGISVCGGSQGSAMQIQCVT